VEEEFELDVFRESSSMERILEMALLTELTQEAWFGRHQLIDLLRSTVDAFGHDVVLECGSVLRHIQIKCRRLTGRTSAYSINTKLAKRPSGCIICIGWDVVPETRRVRMEYRWFGGQPGEPLPDLGSRLAKHAKANAQGIKLERPNIRQLKLSAFTSVDDTSALIDRLFGPREVSAEASAGTIFR
jgi:hypothetical protein